jgi:hypothetical protein
MRRKAFEIRGNPVPPLEKPAAPRLLDIKDVAEISWQGSAGAQSYTVERSQSKNPASSKDFAEVNAEASGPGSTLRLDSGLASSPPRAESRGWAVAGGDISDAAVQYRPLFNDTGVKPGKSYYYRVIAKNSAGASEPSNVVGPIPVSCRTLVDELQDLRFIYKHNGKLSLETKEARKFKEDYHRLKGGKRAYFFNPYIVYKVDAPITSWKVYSFFPEKITDFKFYISADGKKFKQIKKFDRHNYFTGKGLYGHHIPVLYEGAGLGDDAQYLKIEYTAEAQIARVEIKYGK